MAMIGTALRPLPVDQHVMFLTCEHVALPFHFCDINLLTRLCVSLLKLLIVPLLHAASPPSPPSSLLLSTSYRLDRPPSIGVNLWIDWCRSMHDMELYGYQDKVNRSGVNTDRDC